MDNSNHDSINISQADVKLLIENISLLQQENQAIYDTDSNISKVESCESIEIDSSKGH